MREKQTVSEKEIQFSENSKHSSQLFFFTQLLRIVTTQLFREHLSVDTETPSECVCGCIWLGVFPFAVLLCADVIDDAWVIIIQLSTAG